MSLSVKFKIIKDEQDINVSLLGTPEEISLAFAVHPLSGNWLIQMRLSEVLLSLE